jgi:hypothetical protein
MGMELEATYGGPGSGVRVATLDGAELGAWTSRLAEVDVTRCDEAEAIDVITELERLKRAAAAAQARLSVRVDGLARERQQASGHRPERLGQGVAAQIAMARLESPHRGGRDLGLARALVTELPQTLRSMTQGKVSEWQATLVARETACLDPETRRAVDERIASRLPAWGDGQTVREVRKLAYAADPKAVVDRTTRAEAERCVTVRPAPDTMSYLTGLLPVHEGVAAYAALVRAADEARACGDPRTKGQVMADTLVERLTGQRSAPDVPLEIGVVMSAETLLGDAASPAHLDGFGPISAARARALVRDTEAEVWLRRLFAHPDSGQLVAMSSKRYRFDGALRQLLVHRDQFCRAPWCDAPIRHADHARPRRAEGATDSVNGEGLCEACNYAKDAPGWSADARFADGSHAVKITTPTARSLESTAPRAAGHELGLPPDTWRVESAGVWTCLAQPP